MSLGGGAGVVLLLAVVFMLSMYAFCMLDPHIVAFLPPFFGIAVSVGAPRALTLAVLAPFSSLCACLTTYSTGSVLVYYALGHVSVKKWYAVGVLVAVFHCAIWFTVGMLWWKFLGLY